MESITLFWLRDCPISGAVSLALNISNAFWSQGVLGIGRNMRRLSSSKSRSVTVVLCNVGTLNHKMPSPHGEYFGVLLPWILDHRKIIVRILDQRTSLDIESRSPDSISWRAYVSTYKTEHCINIQTEFVSTPLKQKFSFTMRTHHFNIQNG